MIPTPISEKANDDDHEASDQLTTEPRRSTRVRSAPEWYGNPVLEVMLLDHDEPANYVEAMMSPDSAKWLEAMKSEMEGIPNYHLWVSYEDVFVRFWVRVSPAKALSTAAPNIKK